MATNQTHIHPDLFDTQIAITDSESDKVISRVTFRVELEYVWFNFYLYCRYPRSNNRKNSPEQIRRYSMDHSSYSVRLSQIALRSFHQTLSRPSSTYTKFAFHYCVCGWQGARYASSPQIPLGTARESITGQTRRSRKVPLKTFKSNESSCLLRAVRIFRDFRHVDTTAYGLQRKRRATSQQSRNPNLLPAF